MKIAIGSDHRGYQLKSYLMQIFSEYIWLDEGSFDEQRTDYPAYAFKVCGVMQAGSVDHGILICGSGIGMAIAANRVRGIYAALCWNEAVAKVARAHDGANVLVLPADFITLEQAAAITKVWLNTTFLGGRYQERLTLIDQNHK